MSQYALLWQQKLADREKAAKSVKQQAHHAKLSRNAYKKEHDALERSVQQLAAAKFGIILYKTNAEAVVVRCKCGETIIRKGKATSGFGDLVCALPPTGRLCTVELKLRSSRPRDNQREREAELLKAGAAAIVVGSLDEADELLTQLVRGEKSKWKATT